MTFPKLNALIWGTSLLLMLPFISFSANIAIVESQSNHPMQTMDANWSMVVSNMGHTSTILPQTSLDNLSNLDGYDILIISSGLINLPMNRRATAKAFFTSGRSLYLQSEYQVIYPGNMMFEEIITENGNSFTWNGESTGSITPMEVVCGLSGILNEVADLTYFWYGTYGSGDSSVVPFLKNNNKSYGFTYNPSDENLGRVITTTDQDWIRILSSIQLMENIVYTLALPNNSSANLPTVSVAQTDEPICENGTYTFTSTVQNSNINLQYQWQVNGIPVPNSNTADFSSNDLTEGDVVECTVMLDMDCEMYIHVSNPILIAPIFPISEASINIISSTSDICQGEDITFTSSIESEGTYNVIAYQWQVNNNDITGADAPTFTANNLNNNDVVICNVQYTDVCNSLNLISSNEVIVSVNAILTPTVVIVAEATSACPGEELTFTLQGNNWGAQPSFQWQVNGIDIPETENTLNISSLEDGQQVSCILTSSEVCLTTNQISTPPVAVSISNSLTPSLSINVSQTTICPNETVTFTATGINWGSNPFFAWFINGQSTGDNEPVFSSNNLTNNDEVTCIIYMGDPCLTLSEVAAVAEPVTIQSTVTPVISIASDLDAVCKGTEVTFSATIQNGGTSPIYEWSIDNTPIGNNTNTFSTTNLADGQLVSCQLISNADCVTSAIVNSNYVGVEISNITLIVNQQREDYCNQGNGKIQVGTNYAFGQVDYIWNTGATTQTIKELVAGTYNVTATDALGCSTTLSVNLESVNGLEIETLDIQEATCSGNDGAVSVSMKDKNRTYFFTWMTEDGAVLGMDPIIRDVAVGKYLLEITDETDCYLLEEFIVGGSSMITLEMEDRLTTNWGDLVKLEPTITATGNLTFEWFPATGLTCSDCPNPSFTAEQETTYTLTVSNEEGCSTTKTILVQVKKDHEVFIPTAFSPNGDGQNDFFTAFAGDKVRTIKSMTVADRWGNILFKKQDFDVNNEQAGWDGTSRGQRLNVGVYIYTMEVEFIDGLVRSFGGDVTLAR